MTRRVVCILAVAAVAWLAAAPSLYSQAKLDATTGLSRIEGAVTAVDKDKNIITVRQAGRRNVTWAIAYTPETTFTLRNTDAKLESVKVGSQVICLGKFLEPEKEKTKMTATRVEVRSK